MTDGDEARRPRHRWLATLVVVTLIGAALLWFVDVHDAYGCGSSKGVALSPAIDVPASAPGSVGSAPATNASGYGDGPQDALARLGASNAPSMTKEPIPTQGWVEHRGRWVRDLSPDSFYEATLSDTGRGWQVTSYKICGR